MSGIDENTLRTYYGSRLVYDAENSDNNAKGMSVVVSGVTYNADSVYWSDSNCSLYLVWKEVFSGYVYHDYAPNYFVKQFVNATTEEERQAAMSGILGWVDPT
jgi:hypothetical protein